MDRRPPARTAFILAGGASRRMGCDKALLPWGEHTLVDHMRERLGCLTDNVAVAGRGSLPDRFPGEGPVEGIRTALTATTTEENLIVAVDLPFVDVRLLDHLLDRLHETAKPLVAFELEGRIPLCIGARKDLLSVVDGYRDTGGRSFATFVRSVNHHKLAEQDLATLHLGVDTFRNLNTWKDYEDARPGIVP